MHGEPTVTALAVRDRIARGETSAADVAEELLARIAEREADIGAFAFIDAGMVRARARALDEARAGGMAPGPLDGLAVGVKDIVDTADMPTGNGTVLDAGRRPVRDAEVVRRLRAAGAIVIGKTASTELGAMSPGKTRNPHDPSRTPGGSSSGSAAAVAAGMAHLAIGTQTNGSVIRPASFCGVVGFKPTFGMISRSGILPQATSSDTVGVFARTVADAAVLVDALAGHDPADPDTRATPPPGLLAAALGEAQAEPRLAFVKGPTWEKAEPATRDAFTQFTAALASACTEVTLPDFYATADDTMFVLSRAGIARHYGAYLERGRDQLSDWMRAAIEAGRQVTAADHAAALNRQRELGAGLDPIFAHFDAILTPAAPGEAPPLATTGDPAFNTLWSLCGVPAISLPLLAGPNSLPLGVQLVGRRGGDGALLRTGRWLMSRAA